jgi:cell division transport system ATP-binding protein
MIVFSSVTKQFLPDGLAIKDLSFEIEPGELVVLTGPSGSGKTSVMKLLTKEYQPTSGKIVFHDKDLNTIKNSQVPQHRRKIGVVFQDYKLIPELNVWENIALPLSIIGKKEHEIESRVTDLLELVSLTDKALHFPKQLSGGEAQRISIARALSTGPAIIFADEPTGNLDKDNSLQIARLLEKINSLGTTVIFATHDHDVINLFDGQRHIVLSEGMLESDLASKKKKSISKEKVTAESKKEDLKSEDKKVSKEEKTEENKEVSDNFDKKDPKEEIPTIKPIKKQGFFAKLFGSSKKIKISEEITESKEVLKTEEKKDSKEEPKETAKAEKKTPVKTQKKSKKKSTKKSK